MSSDLKELNLSEVSRDTLEKALRAVLSYVEPLIEHEEPEWESNCPKWIKRENSDHIWESGQDNGEAFAAATVRSTIAKTLLEI